MFSLKQPIYGFFAAIMLACSTAYSNDNMITKAVVSTCAYLFPEKQITATTLPTKQEFLSFFEQTALASLMYILSDKISDYVYQKKYDTAANSMGSTIVHITTLMITMGITGIINSHIGTYNQTPEYIRAHGLGLLTFIALNFYRLAQEKA